MALTVRGLDAIAKNGPDRRVKRHEIGLRAEAPLPPIPGIGCDFILQHSHRHHSLSDARTGIRSYRKSCKTAPT
jgi:hypothetical protein